MGWAGSVLITTKELAAGGLRQHEIRALCGAGRLVQVRRGAYRDTAEPAPEPSQEPRTARELEHLGLVAATLPGLRPGACLSHHSAALAHGLPIPEKLLGAVHITRAGQGGKVRPNLHLHRSRVPVEHVICGEHGPMTSLAWTVMDLARVLAPVHAVALVDRALARGLDRQEVFGLLDRHRASGNVTAREVVRFGDRASESVGESHSRWLLHELRLPSPRLQVDIVTDTGDFVARPDFLWEDRRLIGEFDGRIKYGRLLQPGQNLTEVVLAEKRREEALRRLGYWVIRWTWADLDDRDGFRALISRGLALGRRASS